MAKDVCTGCGKPLRVVKIEFDSIPGGVFCPGCAKRIQKQIDEKNGSK